MLTPSARIQAQPPPVNGPAQPLPAGAGAASPASQPRHQPFLLRHLTIGSWAVLAIGTLGIGMSWQLARDFVRRESFRAFDQEAGHFREQIEDRMRLYSNTLYNSRGLFSASVEVTAGEWAAFFQSSKLIERYPGISSIIYSQRVADADLNEFVAKTQAENSGIIPAYLSYSHQPVAGADPHQEHFLVKYIEPLAGREMALGVDQIDSGVRQAAMDRARDTGEPSASSQFRLATNYDGFLIFLPHYRPGAELTTVNQRRDALQGFSAAAFRLSDLEQHIFNPLAAESGIRVSLYQGTDANEQQRFYQSPDQAASSGERFTAVAPVRLPGRVWTMVASAPVGYDLSAGQRQLPLLAGLSGALFLLILLSALSSLSSSRRRAEQIAHQLTAELSQQREFYRNLLETSPDAIAVSDLSGKLTEANGQTAKLYGYASTAEMIGMDLYSLLADDRNALQQEARQVIERGTIERVVHTAQRKDGSRFTAEYSVAVLRDGAGNPQAFLSIARDISERQSYEENLRNTATELKKRSDDLERINQLMVGRELKMVELKQEIAELKGKLGRI